MSDKRKWPRKASLTPCSIELYSSQDGPYPSRVINYSVGGLMIELDRPLAKGEPLKIRFRPDMPNRQRCGENHCLGVVRWCTRQEGDYAGMYGIGVEMAPSTVRRGVTAAA